MAGHLVDLDGEAQNFPQRFPGDLSLLHSQQVSSSLVHPPADVLPALRACVSETKLCSIVVPYSLMLLMHLGRLCLFHVNELISLSRFSNLELHTGLVTMRHRRSPYYIR